MTDIAAAGRVPRQAPKTQSAGRHGRRGQGPRQGVPRWEERRGWGRAVRSKDVTVRSARRQCRLPRAPGRLRAPRCCLLVLPASPRVGDLGSSMPPEQAPASPLLRASLSASTASDGLGSKGQAFHMWREVGVQLLMAGAHLDLLTLTRGHLPPLSLRLGPTDGLCPTRKRRLAGSSGGAAPPRSPPHPPPRGQLAPCPLGVVDLSYFISLFVSFPRSVPQAELGGSVSPATGAWGLLCSCRQQGHQGGPPTRGDCLVCVGKGLLKSVHS